MKNLKLNNRPPFWGLLMLFIVFSCQDINLEEQQSEAFVDIDQALSNAVAGSYIVTLNASEVSFRKSEKYEDVQEKMRNIANEVLLRSGIFDKKIKAVFGHVLTGFVVELSNEEVHALKNSRGVKSISSDKFTSSNQILRNNNPNRGGGGGGSDPDPTTDPEPTPDPEPEIIDTKWYLDRIDQRKLPLDNKFNTPTTGIGVTVYLLDVELDPSLDEFGNRASNENIGLGSGGNPYRIYLGNIKGAVVAGKTLGVAKDANLIAVKLLYEVDEGEREYDVRLSSYIQAIDWVLSDAKSKNGPAVVLSGPISYVIEPMLELAMNELYNSNISIFTSVTNADSNIPTCTTSPSGFSNVFTVGPTTKYDKLGFNGWQYGDCINLFAPGTDILINGFPGAETTDSGIPHFDISYGNSAALAAGVAALYLESNPKASAQQVYDFLFETSTKDIVKFSKSINNHMLFSGLNSDGAGEIDPNRPNYAFDLEASSQKARGNSYNVFFHWNNIESASGMLNVYQDGDAVGSVPNSESFMIGVSGKNLPPRTYKFCVPGTNKCSNEVVVTFN
ncbi:S8 family serine peptidase [Mongoliibacter sp.]|uniref:S8 family serine peptidase n=1 Tax=Mongoliibacter sp. TaxID=2022438 RepID=UPI0025D5BE71|nr:S8 family serine peptidase [Mongoliibacter sp.]